MTLDIFYKLKAQELDSQIQAVRNVISHNFSKGFEGESMLVDFLKTSLPKKYNCSRGFLIDSKGKTSSEIDVMIWNEQFVSSLAFKSFCLMPIEVVSGCVEVKLAVNSQNLKETFKKFSEIIQMTLVNLSEVVMRGRSIGTAKTAYPEMFLFCWEFDLGKTEETIKKNIKSIYDEYPNLSYVKICSLKDGNIAFIGFENAESQLRWIVPETEESRSGQILSFFLYQLFIPSLAGQIAPPDIMLHYLQGYSKGMQI